jgi:hypothetical protein
MPRKEENLKDRYRYDGPFSSLIESAMAAHTESQVIRSQTTTQVSAVETFKLASACFICVVLFKVLSSIDCNSRKLDFRRCKCCARNLLSSGWDEFESFGVRVTIHAVQDVKDKTLFGTSQQYQVRVSFKWSKFITSPTVDMKWEQTKGMEVPQGASECTLTLVAIGKFKNTVVASHSFDTLHQMVEGEGFWGKKQKVKLEKDGKFVGTLIVTFRKKGEGDDGDELPIAGVDEDSSLAMELIKEYEELCDTPGYVKPPDGGKLEGQARIGLLARCLEGSLREIGDSGKDMGKPYIKVICCNYAELKGDDMKEEMSRQEEKAKKKGLREVERKWYWVWYEDKKTC